MPKANVNNIEIEYETIGDPTSKPLLLIAGLGSQLLAWSDEICENLAKVGFFVIRFDNRDVGLSTKFEDAGIPDMMEISAAYHREEKPHLYVDRLNPLLLRQCHLECFQQIEVYSQRNC